MRQFSGKRIAVMSRVYWQMIQFPGHQGNFDYLPWTPSDDALLLEATAERVYDLFPGKPRDKVLRRLQILNRRAAERNV